VACAWPGRSRLASRKRTLDEEAWSACSMLLPSSSGSQLHSDTQIRLRSICRLRDCHSLGEYMPSRYVNVRVESVSCTDSDGGAGVLVMVGGGHGGARMRTIVDPRYAWPDRVGPPLRAADKALRVSEKSSTEYVRRYSYVYA
jgi:hypothetical protein